MRRKSAIAPVLLAFFAALSSGAGAAAPLGACESEPRMTGMRERLATLHEQMDRLEWTTDRAERRVLADLQMKRLRESLRELRNRELGAACRVDLLGSMLEVMVRLQQQMSEQEAR